MYRSYNNIKGSKTRLKIMKNALNSTSSRSKFYHMYFKYCKNIFKVGDKKTIIYHCMLKITSKLIEKVRMKTYILSAN